MKYFDFMKMPVIEDMSKVTLKKGDRFLMGLRIASQRDNKEPGDHITYYEVVDVKGNGNVSYAPRYDKLET